MLILKDHKTCIFNTFRFLLGRASISVCSQQNEEMLFIPFGAESLLQILRYLIFFRWTNKRMLFILYGAECPLFESCGIPSLFCGYEMQNHTHQITWKRLQTRVHAERARQRWGNEHVDDTQRRLNAERERRQQMRANESLEGTDKRVENQRLTKRTIHCQITWTFWDTQSLYIMWMPVFQNHPQSYVPSHYN